MGNVRNDVIITQGLNKLLDKGSISLDKLSTHLATKSEAIGGLNSSDVVTEFKNDRYSRNEQVPTELETPKAVETFVKFVATMDDQKFLGLGGDQNGDLATPGTWQVNRKSQLEQAFVKALTTTVKGSTKFDDTGTAGIVTDKPVASEPKTQTQAETEPATVPVVRRNSQQSKTESPEHGCQHEENSNMTTQSLLISVFNRKPSLEYIDTDKDGVKEPFKENADGTMSPVIKHNGEFYTKMGNGSLKPMMA